MAVHWTVEALKRCRAVAQKTVDNDDWPFQMEADEVVALIDEILAYRCPSAVTVGADASIESTVTLLSPVTRNGPPG